MSIFEEYRAFKNDLKKNQSFLFDSICRECF